MNALTAEIQAAVEAANAPLRAELQNMAALLRQSIEASQEPFVTIKEAAGILKCSEKTIRRNFTKGQCETIRAGRNILIPRAAIMSIQPQG